MKTIARLFFICAALAIAAPALAHHSAAAYDTQKQVKVSGTVVQYRFANPHVYLTLQVKKDDGSVSTVEVEAGAAAVLNGLGFTKDSVKSGEVVTVVGNPARAKPDGFVLGRELYKQRRHLRAAEHRIAQRLRVEDSDGDQHRRHVVLSAHGVRRFPRRLGPMDAHRQRPRRRRRRGRANQERAQGLHPRRRARADVLSRRERDHRAARSRGDEGRLDGFRADRCISMDARIRRRRQTSLQGHSVGRWEGKTLIVETTNFKDHPMGLSLSMPSSTQKKLTERFALSEDGKTLIYSGVLEDPVYLAKPVEWSGKWEYRPTMKPSGEKCNIEVASRFLRQEK